MKPTFKTYAEYIEWKKVWKQLYNGITHTIKQHKKDIYSLQLAISKAKDANLDTSEDQYKLSNIIVKYNRSKVISRKLMSSLEDGKLRMHNITKMKKEINELYSSYPFSLETKIIEFHFNKKSMEFDFIPMWVIKTKGKTYYCNHIDCRVGFTSKERPDHPSTNGSLKIKNATLHISNEGEAIIY